MHPSNKYFLTIFPLESFKALGCIFVRYDFDDFSMDMMLAHYKIDPDTQKITFGDHSAKIIYEDSISALLSRFQAKINYKQLTQDTCVYKTGHAGSKPKMVKSGTRLEYYKRLRKLINHLNKED